MPSNPHLSSAPIPFPLPSPLCPLTRHHRNSTRSDVRDRWQIEAQPGKFGVHRVCSINGKTRALVQIMQQQASPPTRCTCLTFSVSATLAASMAWHMRWYRSCSSEQPQLHAAHAQPMLSALQHASKPLAHLAAVRRSSQCYAARPQKRGLKRQTTHTHPACQHKHTTRPSQRANYNNNMHTVHCTDHSRTPYMHS
jgi:hypothetical protein